MNSEFTIMKTLDYSIVESKGINPANVSDCDEIRIYHCQTCGDFHDETGIINYFFNENAEIIRIKECEICKNEQLADMAAALLASDTRIAKVERPGDDYNSITKFFVCQVISEFAPTFVFCNICHVDFNSKVIMYSIKNKNLKDFIDFF